MPPHPKAEEAAQGTFPEDRMHRIEDPNARMIGFVMAIAESQTLEELGATCHRAASDLVDAPVLGLYLIRERAPDLMYSHNAPRGFLDEYQRELAHCDPMIEMIVDEKHPVAGSLLRPSRRWNVRIMEELLARWGFRGNICGPLLVGSRMAGLIYAADRNRPDSDEHRIERMDFICRSASIALDRILSERSEDAVYDTSAASRLVAAKAAALPPRLAEVATLVCKGQTNKEIARSMAISHHTVKEHIAHLCLRFNVQNRTELAAALLRAPRTEAAVPGRRGDRLAALHDAIFRPSFHDSRTSNDYF
jgi:DNA-binding CsgD family transcriptional regulator